MSTKTDRGAMVKLFLIIRKLFENLHDKNAQRHSSDPVKDLNLNDVKINVLPDLAGLTKYDGNSEFDIFADLEYNVRVKFGVLSTSGADVTPIQIPPSDTITYFDRDYRDYKDTNTYQTTLNEFNKKYSEYRHRIAPAVAIPGSPVLSTEIFKHSDVLLQFVKDQVGHAEAHRSDKENRPPGDLRIRPDAAQDDERMEVEHDYIEFDLSSIPDNTMLRKMFVQYFVMKVLTLHTQIGLTRHDVHAANYEVFRKIQMFNIMFKGRMNSVDLDGGDVKGTEATMKALEAESRAITTNDFMSDLKEDHLLEGNENWE